MRRTKVKGVFKKPKRTPGEDPDFVNISPMGTTKENHKKIPPIGAVKSGVVVQNSDICSNTFPNKCH